VCDNIKNELSNLAQCLSMAAETENLELIDRVILRLHEIKKYGAVCVKLNGRLQCEDKNGTD